ncbi:MAG: HEPN domain-containing protein [Candidatus Aminicenantes bacterium]|nr:HEPN domain-containing protein [Candidatus Aminicenantes bacterium]
MREENKRENIKNELDRASKTLLEADLLFNNNFITGAVSRLYYSLLYTIRALLLTKGHEPRSHEGALRLFGLLFIKENIFETKDSHIFSRLMKYREEADYNPSYMFTREDFIEFKNESEELSNKIRTYMKEKGYLI